MYFRGGSSLAGKTVGLAVASGSGNRFIIGRWGECDRMTDKNSSDKMEQVGIGIMWFWKINLIAICGALILTCTGCNHGLSTETAVIETEDEEAGGAGQDFLQNSNGTADEIAKLYCEIYSGVSESNTSDTLQMMKKIVARLGENGYAAIDSENQIDMAGADQVLCFCEQVEAKKEAELTIIVLSSLDGFILYDFRTSDGNVDIISRYYQLENGELVNKSTDCYFADFWEYTKEGILLFSGTWFSEELYSFTLSDMEEHIALRVQPLDETCRELNRNYIRPIGYERNNMFIVDWSEEDFGELNFYDMYDILYPMVYGSDVFDSVTQDLESGGSYHIAKETFESVIMKYFNIDSAVLQSRTRHQADSSAYIYHPRGFYDTEYPGYPFSEVVDYGENADGTITLTVNAVFPYENIAKVFTHEVVVRPLPDGGVQYVSNRIIPSEDNYTETWHISRLTDEEWREYEGK